MIAQTRQCAGIHKGKIAFWLLPCAAVLCFVYGESLLHAEEMPHPSKDSKGFFQLDLSTGVTGRTVVEDLSPGNHFEGDAISTRVMAKLSVKPWYPLEFYGQVGAANIDISDFNDFQGDYGFAYGGGLSLLLYENPGPRRFQFYLQGDTLRFASSDQILTDIDLNGDNVIDVSEQNIPVNEKIRWREYAVQGLGVWRGYRWEPYLGARFSWLDSTDTLDHPQIGKLSLKEDSNFGLVLGSSLYLDPRQNFALNFEASLVDQASFKVGVRVWY